MQIMEENHISMRQINSYPLRLSQKLRSKCTEAAKENKRSLNAEILVRLEKSFEPIPNFAEAKEEDSKDLSTLSLIQRMDSMRMAIANISVMLDEAMHAIKQNGTDDKPSSTDTALAEA